MDFSKFQRVQRVRDIQKTFFHTKQDNPEVILWQNLMDKEQRIKKRSKFFQYVIDKGECWLKPRNGMFQFYSNHPLYFYFPKKKIIFKRFIFFNSPLKIIVKEPKELMLESKRYYERKEPTEKKLVNIRYGFDRNSSVSLINLKLEVLNFTEDGMALKSNLNNILKFDKGRPIKIESLTRRGEFVEGVVRHMTKTYDPQKSQFYFILGIRFMIGLNSK